MDAGSLLMPMAYVSFSATRSYATVIVEPSSASSAVCSSCALRMRGSAVNVCVAVVPSACCAVTSNDTLTSGSPVTPVTVMFVVGEGPAVVAVVAPVMPVVVPSARCQETLATSFCVTAWQYQVVPARSAPVGGWVFALPQTM